MSLLNSPKLQETKALSRGPAFLVLCASILLLFVWAGIAYRVFDMRISAKLEVERRVDVAAISLAEKVAGIETSIAAHTSFFHTLVAQTNFAESMKASELGMIGETLGFPVSLYTLDGTNLAADEANALESLTLSKAVRETFYTGQNILGHFLAPDLSTKSGFVYFGKRVDVNFQSFVLVFKVPASSLLSASWISSVGSVYRVTSVDQGGTTYTFFSGPETGVPPFKQTWYGKFLLDLPSEVSSTKSVHGKGLLKTVTFTAFGSDIFADIEYRSKATFAMGVIMSILIFLVMGINFYLLNRVRFKHHSLIRLVTLDSLTELPNRRSLNEELDALFKESEDKISQAGLLFVDLDNFKPVNDTHGHKMGDMLLRAVARRLQNAVGPRDTICRLGGDEFAIIVRTSGELENLRKVANSVVGSFHEPFVLDGIQIHAAASVGLAYAKGCRSSSELLKNADMAMYDAKNAGKGLYREYSFEMAQKALQEEQLSLALKPALSANQFRLVYQPKINSFTGKVSGFEALVRWWHPQLGAISPGVFIPLAEANGLIHELGGWVLAEAIKQLRDWHTASGRWHVVAVNVSAIQLLDPFFVGKIKRLLDTFNVPATALQVELTESVLASNVQNAKKVLGQLRKLGIKIAIDDFGTGYSSLNSLQQFDIDYLKVDQSFVRDMGTDSGNKICKSIISLAHSLGLVVIAEGVETQEQFDTLFEMGCDELQGFMLSKPLSEDLAPLFDTDSLGLWQQISLDREHMLTKAMDVDLSSPVSELQLLEHDMGSGFDTLN